MTYRELLAAIERAKELEQRLFLLRNRETAIHSHGGPDGYADRGRATHARVPLPSPFKTHNGRSIPHLRITDAGRIILAAVK